MSQSSGGTGPARWKRRPQGSNWGDFGPDDELGRVNLLTPERILRAAREIREGRTFCLSLPLNIGHWQDVGRGGPQLEPLAMPGGGLQMNYPVKHLVGRPCPDVVCDDKLTMGLQFSTQWDALGHVGSLFDADDDGEAEVVYYNGWRGYEHITGPVDYRTTEFAPLPGAQGIGKMAIDTMAKACMQGRGVMIDLAHHFGLEPRPVGYDDLAWVMERDGVEVEPGDMVCLCTGVDTFLLENWGSDRLPKETPGPSLNGRDNKLLNWITDSGLVALISDHPSLETYPPLPADKDTDPLLGIHQHCLFKLGIPLGELWLLSPLAQWLRENARTRFFLTAPPLNLPFAAGSPLTPVATV